MAMVAMIEIIDDTAAAAIQERTGPVKLEIHGLVNRLRKKKFHFKLS